MTKSHRSTFNINETWFEGWNPLRDEYGYPINTTMPPGFYIEHGSSVIKRWYPETGMWNHFMDLTRMSPDTFRDVIFRVPPELPFEALDHDTKKSVRKARSQGRVRRHIAPLPATLDPTGDARRRRERNAIYSRRFGVAAVQIGGVLAAVALLVRLLMG
ncbi:hypothetical protein [Paenarthrobacter sp. NPDC090522]|uniref:hypothetical protein n=1 Tax=Paenarthrobacter sp. NPDC090522 TaxID=3364383 RepID=UPI00382A4BED